MTELKKLTLRCLLENSAEKYSDRPALSFIDSRPISYAELYEEVIQLIRFLQSQGIAPGDKVAILSENQPNWGIAYFAVTLMGAVAVPILPDFHTSEILHIIRHSECKAIFVSRRLLEKIEEARFLKSLKLILIDNFEPITLQGSKTILKEVLNRGEREISKLKQSARKLGGKLHSEPEEDDLAVIIYTSGTTGHSKGVMLTHKNLVSNATSALSFQKVTPGDRLVSILPLSHTYECTIGFLIPILQGACIYYLNKPPTPRLLLEAMQKVKPTIMLSVPLVIEKIYKTRVLPELTRNGLLRRLYKISPIRKRLHRIAGKKLLKSFGGELVFFGIGGALLAPEVEHFLREARFPYAIGYGLTETSPLVAGSGKHNTRFRSTGPPIEGVEVKIHDPNPETGEGEIWVRGPNVMKGYYKDPERTASVLTEDGWFKTGDLGYLDKDNYLYIKGRLKNMIVGPSGENIYPEEIEAILNEFDYVMESLVYMHENKLTARVHLNYEELDELFGKENLTETEERARIQQLLEQIRTEVNSRVSSYSRLHRIIEQTEPFEKTPTQKTKRYLYVN
ncbi:MAG: long-chain fatty acid--CoA ligase [Calditrichia bacterium]